jgi:hypothetical protein
MESYPIQSNDKQKENQIIQNILQVNKYNLPDHNRKRRQQNWNQTESIQPNKWAHFTYLGRETRVITKIFQKADIKKT